MKYTFDDFAKLCPAIDLSPFRDAFSVMFDAQGAIPCNTVGFHFSFDAEDEDRDRKFKDLVALFNPIAIWAGKEDMRQHIALLGYQSTLSSYFEDGGFIVVLKTPITLVPAEKD